jgi:hypothetical protein
VSGTNGQSSLWNESIVISKTAFHGRGFCSPAFQPGDRQAPVAAVEAVDGMCLN